jgi:TldD protein
MRRSNIKNILASERRQGADFAEIFLEHKKTTSIKLEDSKIEHIRQGTDCGAGLRTLHKHKTNYSYTNDVDFPFKYQPVPGTLAEKVTILEQANRTARAVSEKVKQVTVSYLEHGQQVHITNTTGLAADEYRQHTRFMIQVIAATDTVIQTAYEAPGCLGGFSQVFARHNAEELALMVAKRAVKMLTAPHAPAGEMPVVLMSEAGGTMIHEACGHSLEADFIMKKTSVFTEKLGQKIASPLITVIDDGTLPTKFGSFTYDDEGTKAAKTVLIEKGVLTNLLTDKLTAQALNLPLTGNGRRESFRHRPVPRMTNTYVAPGQDNPDEIIKSIDYGLLVKRMGGGQVDVTNGEFVFEVNEGYLIQDGQVTTPVRGATLIGSGPQVLATIDMVGSDLFFQEGICGKYDRVPVSDAQPTIRIPRIVVGGRK